MVDDIATLDWASVPQDGRLNVLVSTRRARYGAAAQGWKPDLHIALWNPYQALDVAGPTLLSWGFAPGAGRPQGLAGRPRPSHRPRARGAG
jgi:beta-N-acetylhexosaminidase